MRPENLADDDEPVTKDWLQSVGFRPRGDNHPDCGPIMVQGCVMMAANGKFVHLQFTRQWDQEPRFTSFPNKETRGKVRMLFEGLGIPWGGKQPAESRIERTRDEMQEPAKP